MSEIDERTKKSVRLFRISKVAGRDFRVASKGCIVRLSDKMARIMNVARDDEISVSSETITDTLMDLAVYAIITRILYEDFKRSNI